MSKVIIVTGASKGIGAAVADYLLSQSHKVVLTARSSDALKAKKDAHPDQVEYVAGDVTSEGVAEQVVSLTLKTFGRIDGMVLSHGVLSVEKMKDVSLQNFKHLYDVNVFSCLSMVLAALAELRKTNGSVVWVSSGAAVKPYMAWSAYGSSKSAMNALSAHLAVEEPSITSIAIAPGRVDTEMQGVLRDTGKDTMDKAQYQTFVDGYQNGELLKPSQPGNVIARLAISPDIKLSGKAINWNHADLAAFQDS